MMHICNCFFFFFVLTDIMIVSRVATLPVLLLKVLSLSKTKRAKGTLVPDRK